MRKLILSLAFIFFSTLFCPAQVFPSVFNSAGGTYDNALSYHRFEWSIGESALVETFVSTDSSVLVTQGVLQPCLDKVANSPMITVFEPGDYRLFPNPTIGQFELDFFIKETGQMTLELTDAIGRVLEKRTYHYNGCCRIEQYDITRYPAGVYFIVATLQPDHKRAGDGIKIIRHSGLKIAKMN